MSPEMRARRLMADCATALWGVRFDLSDEVRLHGEMEAVLASVPGAAVSREVVIGARCRIDFTVVRGGVTVGVEVKRVAQRGSILKQINRYAETGRLDGLVLVSATAIAAPDRLSGVPLSVLSLGAAFL